MKQIDISINIEINDDAVFHQDECQVLENYVSSCIEDSILDYLESQLGIETHNIMTTVEV